MNKRRYSPFQIQPATTDMTGTACRLIFMATLIVGACGIAGCAPKVRTANAIQPSQPGDTKEVWIYLNTDDDAVDGVYRCYDAEQKPVCKRATLVTK